MTRKMSELVIKLTDMVSGPAKKVAQALKAAERQTKAIAAATKAGISGRMVTDLQRIGASHQQIDRVTRAWDSYRRSAGLAADASKWTKNQIAAVRTWERANIAALKSVNAAQAQRQKGHAPARRAAEAPAETRRGALLSAAAAPARYIAPAAALYGTARAVKSYAEADRAIKRIGITAEATDKEIAAVGATAFGIAQEVAMPYEKIVTGLDTLVAQGRNLKDSMDFLPAVSRTAAAANAEVEDIAKTADSVGTNFKIAGRDMQKAFDIMTAGGKAGQFELKDMARYLPSMGPAAAAAGFTGEQGLTDLVSMLQIMRKGSGTSEEAAASMLNIFQKMFSEETTKRFKKFGVDLPKAMEKGRKEGRNLVEVFEELTSQALKGDLSKIPQLINDMEFARGIRAILSYKGEWQKLSGTIAKSAPGSVVQDLARVTNDAQGKLDRMGNTMTRTWQNLGRVVHDVTGGLKPLTEMNDLIERIYNHDPNKPLTPQHKAFNQNVNQLFTGFDNPEERERVTSAHREKEERDAVDKRVAELDARIAEKEKQLSAMPGGVYSPFRWRVEKDLKPLKDQRAGIQEALSARDRANIELIENEAALKRSKTRMGLDVSGKPTPITPGIFSFGLGAHGTNLPPEPGPTVAPLPPARPPELPKAVPTLNSFEDIWKTPKVVKPEVDSTDLTAAKDKAAEAKEAVDGLNVNVTPKVETGSLREALSYAQALNAELRRTPGLVSGAKTTASRGRSEIATATANLSRSRQTSLEDRPYS